MAEDIMHRSLMHLASATSLIACFPFWLCAALGYRYRMAQLANLALCILTWTCTSLMPYLSRSCLRALLQLPSRSLRSPSTIPPLASSLCRLWQPYPTHLTPLLTRSPCHFHLHEELQVPRMHESGHRWNESGMHLTLIMSSCNVV